jgi:hypothetical protein
MEAFMPKLRNGHAPGHVRDTFLAAIEAFVAWKPGEPEPTVEYEIGYVPHRISISRACGLVWNCTDIVPGSTFDWLQEHLSGALGDEPAIRRRTYAACARAMLQAVQSA